MSKLTGKILSIGDSGRKELVDRIVEVAEVRKNCKFLDIGSSDGILTLRFGKKIEAKDIFGVDLDPPIVKGIKFTGCDLDQCKRLPFKDEYFDVILCNQVAEHLISPDTIFKEIRRLLKKGGYAIISVPNLCALHNRLFVLFGFQPTAINPSTEYIVGRIPRRVKRGGMSGPSRHLAAFSPTALEDMIKIYGLKLEELTGDRFYPFTGKIAGVLSALFPSLAVYLIVKVRK